MATTRIPPDIPPVLQLLVQAMLPTIPVDQLYYLRGYKLRDPEQHWGVDVQAKGGWKNCEKRGTRGKGEPVCTPIRGKIIRVDKEPDFLWNPKTKLRDIPNRDADKVSGVIIAQVDAQGNEVPDGYVVGLRHMEGMEKWRGKEGALVEAGTQIGTMSDIGSSGAVHLHAEFGKRAGNGVITWLQDPLNSNWLDWWTQSRSTWPMFPVMERKAVIDRMMQCPGIEEEEEEEEEPRRDPLVVNLDGKGAKTVGLDRGVNFDFDRNGFQETTGWLAPGSGFLMLDKNGNGGLDDGGELFGDFTILPNGTRAGNGFQALAFYDTNGDGKIDANDPIWSKLRIWQYVESDEDAESFGDPESDDGDASWNRISTLDEVGITAIHLDYVIVRRQRKWESRWDIFSGELVTSGLNHE
ncbi:MAG TPA: hypothetical protein VK463_03835 [Desulfomonilaceae bacterium]|nr:hypothetical protein [Desulfomonilaceae bacterium]